MSVNSPFDVCSNALVLLGSKPINSFTGGDKETTCGLLYPMDKESLLTSYPWKFCTAKAQLARLTDAPLTSWKYAYKLPLPRLGAPLAYYNSGGVGATTFLEWEVQGADLLCNEEVVFCDYQFDVVESRFPPYFVNLIVLSMAAKLALPVTRDQSKADFYRGLAYGSPSENEQGGAWLAATNADARGQTNIALHPDSWSLVNVRG
jgi:hypothetical protein